MKEIKSVGELSTEPVLNGARAAGASMDLEAGLEAGSGLWGEPEQVGEEQLGVRTESSRVRLAAAPQSTNPSLPSYRAAKERPKE